MFRFQAINDDVPPPVLLDDSPDASTERAGPSGAPRYVQQQQQQTQEALEARVYGDYEEALRLMRRYGRGVNSQALVYAEELLRSVLLRLQTSPFRHAAWAQWILFAAHRNLGDICFSATKYADALTHYVRAIAIHPNDPVVCFRTGVSASRVGQLHVARAAFERGLLASPTFSACRDALETISRALGEATLSVEDCRIQLDGKGNDHGGVTVASTATQRKIDELCERNSKLRRIQAMKGDEDMIFFDVGTVEEPRPQTGVILVPEKRWSSVAESTLRALRARAANRKSLLSAPFKLKLLNLDSSDEDIHIVEGPAERPRLSSENQAETVPPLGENRTGTEGAKRTRLGVHENDSDVVVLEGEEGKDQLPLFPHTRGQPLSAKTKEADCSDMNDASRNANANEQQDCTTAVERRRTRRDKREGSGNLMSDDEDDDSSDRDLDDGPSISARVTTFLDIDALRSTVKSRRESSAEVCSRDQGVSSFKTKRLAFSPFRRCSVFEVFPEIVRHCHEYRSSVNQLSNRIEAGAGPCARSDDAERRHVEAFVREQNEQGTATDAVSILEHALQGLAESGLRRCYENLSRVGKQYQGALVCDSVMHIYRSMKSDRPDLFKSEDSNQSSMDTWSWLYVVDCLVLEACDTAVETLVLKNATTDTAAARMCEGVGSLCDSVGLLAQAHRLVSQMPQPSHFGVAAFNDESCSGNQDINVFGICMLAQWFRGVLAKLGGDFQASTNHFQALIKLAEFGEAVFGEQVSQTEEGIPHPALQVARSMQDHAAACVESLDELMIDGLWRENLQSQEYGAVIELLAPFLDDAVADEECMLQNPTVTRRVEALRKASAAVADGQSLPGDSAFRQERAMSLLIVCHALQVRTAVNTIRPRVFASFKSSSDKTQNLKDMNQFLFLVKKFCLKLKELSRLVGSSSCEGEAQALGQTHVVPGMASAQYAWAPRESIRFSGHVLALALDVLHRFLTERMTEAFPGHLSTGTSVQKAARQTCSRIVLALCRCFWDLRSADIRHDRAGSSVSAKNIEIGQYALVLQVASFLLRLLVRLGVNLAGDGSSSALLKWYTFTLHAYVLILAEANESTAAECTSIHAVTQLVASSDAKNAVEDLLQDSEDEYDDVDWTDLVSCQHELLMCFQCLYNMRDGEQHRHWLMSSTACKEALLGGNHVHGLALEGRMVGARSGGDSGLELGHGSNTLNRLGPDLNEGLYIFELSRESVVDGLYSAGVARLRRTREYVIRLADVVLAPVSVPATVDVDVERTETGACVENEKLKSVDDALSCSDDFRLSIATIEGLADLCSGFGNASEALKTIDQAVRAVLCEQKKSQRPGAQDPHRRVRMAELFAATAMARAKQLEIEYVRRREVEKRVLSPVYVAEEYARAVKCAMRAVQVQPLAPSLWALLGILLRDQAHSQQDVDKLLEFESRTANHTNRTDDLPHHEPLGFDYVGRTLLRAQGCLEIALKLSQRERTRDKYSNVKFQQQKEADSLHLNGFMYRGILASRQRGHKEDAILFICETLVSVLYLRVKHQSRSIVTVSTGNPMTTPVALLAGAGVEIAELSISLRGYAPNKRLPRTLSHALHAEHKDVARDSRQGAKEAQDYVDVQAAAECSYMFLLRGKLLRKAGFDAERVLESFWNSHVLANAALSGGGGSTASQFAVQQARLEPTYRFHASRLKLLRNMKVHGCVDRAALRRVDYLECGGSCEPFSDFPSGSKGLLPSPPEQPKTLFETLVRESMRVLQNECHVKKGILEYYYKSKYHVAMTQWHILGDCTAAADTFKLLIREDVTERTYLFLMWNYRYYDLPYGALNLESERKFIYWKHKVLKAYICVLSHQGQSKQMWTLFARMRKRLQDDTITDQLLLLCMKRYVVLHEKMTCHDERLFGLDTTADKSESVDLTVDALSGLDGTGGVDGRVLPPSADEIMDKYIGRIWKMFLVAADIQKSRLTLQILYRSLSRRWQLLLRHQKQKLVQAAKQFLVHSGNTRITLCAVAACLKQYSLFFGGLSDEQILQLAPVLSSSKGLDGVYHALLPGAIPQTRLAQSWKSSHGSLKVHADPVYLGEGQVVDGGKAEQQQSACHPVEGKETQAEIYASFGSMQGFRVSLDSTRRGEMSPQ
ncbi:hypothetical protein FVE85_1741 [Porphyridium purpureum]|uniref:Uncharacterized protein n=1 Tax=Porphyridium purpureum TaxID=35688 RepID=A0A5J4YW92_PORPP|nr:hypothetical protein FVE85_1741 [Porphyridium purpureum]|eukprot:POR2441..scf209_3